MASNIPHSDSELLDSILEELLGEFHEHKCVTRNGTNGGCINCRKTGYDQSPCKICDKDGIAFKNRNEAKTALLQWADRRAEKLVVEATEHYIVAYGSSTGTGNRCACGKSFVLLDSIKGHIQWNLAALTATKEEA